MTDTPATVRDDCVFCSIVRGDAPAHEVYRDDRTMAFLDHNAVGEGHTLVVPTDHAETIFDIDTGTVGEMFATARRVCDAIDVAFDPDGYTLVQSNGEAAGQDVEHAHVHVLPREYDDGYGLAPSRTPLSIEDGQRTAARLRTALDEAAEGAVRTGPKIRSL